jgi:hypothetical protein
MVAASLSSEILLLGAALAALLAWRLVRPSSRLGGTRSDRFRFNKKIEIKIGKAIELPEGAVGPDGLHLDDSTRARMHAAGLDPADLQSAFEDLKPGEVKTVVDIKGGPLDDAARAAIDAELDKLGIDHTDIDAKLARGDSFHWEQRKEPEK